MPGFILHLTAAKMLLDKFHIPVDQNAFYIGNLLPDTAADKEKSHFRAIERCGKMVEYPETDVFAEKYRALLTESSALGYYYHLYIDRKFLKEFYPRVLRYLNADRVEEEDRDKVVWAYVCKTKEIVPVRQFLSEEYYYGDFTRMNRWLVDRYQLPLNLDPFIKNPGIEEVDYRKAEIVLEQLMSYMSQPVEMVNELKVFDIEELLIFLENAAAEWHRMNC